MTPNEDPTDPEFLTVEDVAARLKVREKTVRDWILRGERAARRHRRTLGSRQLRVAVASAFAAGQVGGVRPRHALQGPTQPGSRLLEVRGCSAPVSVLRLQPLTHVCTLLHPLSAGSHAQV